MAHPTLSKNQAIVVNVVALGMIAALTIVGVLKSISLIKGKFLFVVANRSDAYKNGVASTEDIIFLLL